MEVDKQEDFQTFVNLLTLDISPCLQKMIVNILIVNSSNLEFFSKPEN